MTQQENLQTVQMTEEELAQFQAYKEERERIARQEQRKTAIADYERLVDEEVASAIDQLRELSDTIAVVKAAVFTNFKTILEMKKELFGFRRPGQHKHSFTNSGSTLRVTLGRRVIDSYKDTVEEGIAMVRTYLESLAKDEHSAALVKAVMDLLAKDKAGNLKASRVLQLSKMAEESGNEDFIEGVRVIANAYNPSETKEFIRAEYKNPETGGWVSIPLSVTDAEY